MLWLPGQRQPVAGISHAAPERSVDVARASSPAAQEDEPAGPEHHSAVAKRATPRRAPVAAMIRARRAPAMADAAPVNGKPPASLPLEPDFLDRLMDAARKRASFPLPDGRAAEGAIELVRHDAEGVLLVQGRLTQPEPGFFFFQRQTVPGVAGAMVGNVRFDKSGTAFRVDPLGIGGAPVLVQCRLDQVICLNLVPPDPDQMAAEEPENAPQAHPTSIPIPAYQNGVIPLQSLPGATGVIYLDFDGETGPFPGWGNFNAAASGSTNAQIKEVWQRVAEDFQGFNLNITTDRSVFDNAPQGSRQHVILTPTTDAAPGAGGVAYLDSYNDTGDTVCWAYYWTGKNAAEVVSHEVGHTLGLSHDGRISPSEGYYAGHGSGDTGWAPIMGVGYYENLSQWSKGEYLSADNTEDDLAIIVGNNNNVDYRADDYGATFATAGYLEILANNSVSNEGIIEMRTDVDAFRFTTTGGAVSFTASTVSAGPNLDILAEIFDSANTLIASNNPDSGINATVAATLGAGDFTLRVSGVGRGSATGDGYTDYASTGTYLITGSVVGGEKPDRFTIAENSAGNAAVGTVVPRNAHGANPLSFAIASGNTGTAFAIDPVSGAITVATPSQLNFETLSTRWDDPATFQLFVTITDSTSPELDESIRVVITVSDVNEPPLITGGAVTILEHTGIGTNVFKVMGSDPDRFEFPVFSIVAGNTGGAFAINAETGQITIAADTEATVQSVYSLTIRASDHGTPALTADAIVTVTLENIQGNYTTGTITRFFYEGISGNGVSSLTSSSKFPDSPDSQQTLTSFDGGTGHGTNYGSTIRGYLIAPATGSYTFWIASDNASELRISPDISPANAVVRATSPNSNSPSQYQWTKFSSQQSIALSLTAGSAYYIEARHKQASSSDHLAVAWQGPGISQQVIPGSFLAPDDQNIAPQWVGAPYSFSIPQNPANGTAAGTVTALDLNNDILTYSITGGNTGAAFAINAQSGVISVADNATLTGGQSIVLQITAQDDDTTPLSITTTATITVQQALGLVTPQALPVNIPANTGLHLEVTNYGRTGTTLAWSEVSGPGDVTFDSPSSLATGAIFSTAGTYVLRCTETGGAISSTLDVTVSAGVADHGFAGTKVGAQSIQPGHTFANGTYTISAAGTGIPSSSTPDDFYFLNQPVTGDVTITARLVSVQAVSGSNSRAGVMIRDTPAAGSIHAFCGVNSAGSGRWIYRATAGTNSANSQATAGQPYWIRLIRSGNIFTAQFAPDNAGTPGTFTTAGSAQTLAMGGTALVGLAATSGSTTTAGSTVIDNVTIVPSPVNIGVAVSAGSDASVALPAGAALDGTVSDDAKPVPPGAFTTTWTKRSGPGAVTFGNAAAADTTADFTLPGIYTLRLTADDGAVKTFDETTITATYSTTVNITASDTAAGEQGLDTGQFTITRTGPTAGALAVNFTAAGSSSAGDYAALPASVVIADGQTSATLTITPVDDALVESAETVVITLADGQYNIGASDSATITITDNDAVPTVTITSPTAATVNMHAGTGLILEANVSDDGLPGPLALTWSKVSGPGIVTFSNANTANTAANFSALGSYVLRLSATDGQFTSAADVAVNFGSVNSFSAASKVGAQAVEPGYSFSAGTYSISAAGDGIPSNSTPDDFYFINAPATGDVTITARIVSVQNVTGTSSRAGVMIRETLAADAREAFCGVTSLGSGRWIYRATAGTSSANATMVVALPYWVRLTRTGNSFDAQLAPDSAGTPGAFTAIGTTQTIGMGSNVLIGLAATSGSTTAASAIVVDNVTITSAPLSANVAPNVSAGTDATITLAAPVAAVNGTVSDDALPAPPAVSTSWTTVSGPGPVVFGNAALVDTTASFSALGDYVLRLIATDGEVKTFDDVTITVQPAPIDQWRTAQFGANAGVPGIAGDLADPDGDGIANLIEYALGLDPLAPGIAGEVVDVEAIGESRYLRLTASKNPGATDVTFAVEVNAGLEAGGWTTSGTTIETNTGTTLRVRDNTEITATPQRSIRLKITHP